MARKSSFAESVINGTYGTNEKKENTQQPIQTQQTTKQPEITVKQPTKRSSFADSVINGTYGTTTTQPSSEPQKTSPKINLSSLKGVGEVNDKTANITNADISSKIMDYHNAFASRKGQYEAMDEALDELAKDDGYHFGDITKFLINGAIDLGGKTIGTVADIGGNILHGGLQALEGGADALQYLGADINDLFGRSKEAELLRQNARFNSTGALFGENKPNETIVQQNILEELDKHSWSPEIIDDIANGVGGVGMNAALATVGGGSTLATNASIFATSYGDAMSDALNNGASVSDARLWALIDASASTLAENAFNNKFGMNTKGFAGKYLKGKFGNALDNVIKSKPGKVLFNVLKDSLEEGSEEVIETMVGNFTKSLAYNITDLLSNVNPDIKFEYGRDKVSKDMIEEFFKPLTQKETLERFIMASLTSAVYNVGAGAITNVFGNNQQMAQEPIQEETQQPIETPQIQQNQENSINNQPVMEQTQLDLNEPNNETIQNKVDLGLKETPKETNNIPETKTDATNQIVINNNGKQTSTNIDTKAEDTGVSINGKRVAIEIPTNTHKNSLGQDVLNNINTEKVKKGDGDSRFYETITERSQFVEQEVKDRASQDDFIKHYDKITNQESLDKAIDKLSQEGTSAISEFFSKNKQLTPDDTAMGIVLFEQAQNAGDYEMANNVLRKLRSNATTTAQVLQLYSVFSRMTPEGMYKYAGGQLLKAQEIFEKNKSKKWIEQNRDRWQLNPDEVEFIKSQMEKVQELNNSNEKMAEVSLNGYGVKDNGKTIKVTKERATQLEIAKIQKLIEDKIPAEKGQATKAWMRISMLGNPKTIATRNPLGNLLFSPVNTVGDYFGSAIDKLVSLKTKVRTKGGTNVPTSIKGFVEGGRESIQDKKIGVNTRDIAGNRFEIGQGKSFNENHNGLLANQRNKVSKVLNKMDRGVSFVLDLGDRPFYQAAFENSLANQMKLNNIEDVDNAPQWMLDNAQQEALERTWQDDNKYTSFVLSIRKALNNLNVKGYGIGDLLIPFAKTPANLTKAIVDYSPAGLINAMTQGNNLRKSISNGQFTPQMQHQFVNQLGKAFAGSLLYVAAASLANAGIITGAADEDRDVADFMRYSLGIQPYSIVIGDSSFTYDWAQPVAAPFAIMADLKKKLDSSNGEADLGFILKSAINSSSSILLEQSFLQGIQDVLGGYGDPVDNLLSEIEGLPARAVPTFFQQLATLIDGKQRMSYGNDGISNVLSQAQAKVPGWASDLPVKRNSLGQEVERYGGENNIFNVFFNPANYSQGRATESAKEIYKIYQATNDKTILPRTVTNNIKNEDGTNLTNAQKSEFMRISGSIVDENVKELKNNKDYQKMSDEDKAAVIKKIVDYAYNKAREQVTNHTLASEYKKADQAIETGYALYDYYSTKQSTKQTKTTNSNNSKNRYEEMKAMGIDGETFDKFKAFVSSAKGESTTGGPTKKQKILNWINSQKLTQEQKDNLYNDYVTNSKIYSSYN